MGMQRVIMLSLLMGVAISLSGCGGGEVPSAEDGSRAGAANASGDISARELIPLLTRHGVGPGESGIDLTYAPQLFFDVTGLVPPAEMGSRPTLAFVLEETIHEGALPGEPPPVFLELESGDRVSPYSAQVTAEDPHHRTVRLLFPQPNGWSTESEQTLTLVAPLEDGTVSVGNTFEWRLPIDLGGGADESEEG